MNRNYAYTPEVWISIFSTFFLILLAIFTGRRRSVPGATSFMIACLFTAIWAAGSLMEIAALDLETKIFWFKFQAVAKLSSATAVTCFVLVYTWPGRWLTKRNLSLLSIGVLLYVGLIFTNDFHHLIWRGFALNGMINPLINPGGWLLIAYGVGLGITNIIVLVWLAIRSPQHRWPVTLIVTSTLAVRGLYTLETTGVIEYALPLDTLAIGFASLIYAVALFVLRLFNPVAMARLTLMEQLSDGMLVLDSQGRVVRLNPAAERIFALPVRQVQGKLIWELLPAYPSVSQTVASGTEIELTLATGEETGHYQLVVSLLNDWWGQEAGRLLLLRNVTGQKRDHAQLLEQQRALAILRERELLARELHDSLGQVLGYAKMQAQAARDQLAQDQKEAADLQLAQLVAVTQDAHVDVREYILGATTGVTGQSSFLPALRQYLKRFGEQYGLRAVLDEPSAWHDNLLQPTVGAQLVRIIQEALTNVRKHARANQVQVILEVDGSRARVIIQDDGAGFDPALLHTAPGQKYGLAFISERAAEVGGSVTLQSAPGQGTSVVVEVPVSGEPVTVNNER